MTDTTAPQARRAYDGRREIRAHQEGGAARRNIGLTPIFAVSAEIAPQVRALAARYGVPYNTGSLKRQFGTTALKILRLSLPGGRSVMTAV